MTLPVKTFDQFVQDQVSAWANAIGITPALTDGDALLAAFQAFAGQLLFIQSQVQLVVALTRAQTSTGADLDSWMAQFNFTRLPATFAEGEVTFAKNQAATSQVLIPAATLSGGVYSGGTTVQTTGGAIQYQVIPDTTQPTYNSALNAYVLAVGQISLTASVQALASGSAYNVSAGQLVQIGSSLAGIDSVTNAAAINNGANAETDSAFLARFPLYLASLAKATEEAILYAATSVQLGLTASALENELPTGATQNGSFTVVVDNGSGTTPSGTVTDVYNAVFAVRAFTVQPFVVAATVLTATIVLAVRVASGYVSGTVTANVQTAISAAVDALADGATLYVSTVEAAALSVAGVTSVQPATTTINGSQADLVPTAFQVIKSATTNITVNTY